MQRCSKECSYYRYHAGPHEHEGPETEAEWHRRMEGAERAEIQSMTPEERAQRLTHIPSMTVQDVLDYKATQHDGR